MKNSLKFVLRLTLAAMLFFVLLPALAGPTLSNGQKAYIGQNFTISMLGTRKAKHDELRSFAKQVQAIRKVEKVLISWGIDMSRKVHFRYYTDTDFPAKDMWLSAGINPDSKAFDKYEEDIGMVFASMSGYEFAHMADEANDKYFFTNPFSDYLSRKYYVNPRKISGQAMTDVLEIVKKERNRMETDLSKPVGKQLKDYMIFEDAAYSPDKGVLWVPIKNPATLHRYLETAVHEYGHHAFNNLTRQILNKYYKKRKWTNSQIFFVSQNILAVNEFFADYVAVSNGYNTNLNVHNWKSAPKDVKRVFSQKRTLKDHMDGIRNGNKSLKWYLSEGHNSLNPMRSFVWKLRLAIGERETDQLVVDAVKAHIYNFYVLEIPKLKRVRLTNKGWGCFTVKGYKTDAETENLRFLKLMQKAADKRLSKENKAKFATEASKIFEGYYPLK